ncbi:hypothetical protein J3F81_005979, partial [Coemansia sp. RSA 371]
TRTTCWKQRILRAPTLLLLHGQATAHPGKRRVRTARVDWPLARLLTRAWLASRLTSPRSPRSLSMSSMSSRPVAAAVWVTHSAARRARIWACPHLSQARKLHLVAACSTMILCR